MHASTRAVHAGRPPHEPDQPLNVPITMASVFVAGGEREYGRWGNPSWVAFEEALGALEGGSAISFASGMAAVSAVLDLLGQEAVVVAPTVAYSGSLSMLADLEMRGRARTKLIDFGSLDDVRAAIDDDVAIVWVESPTNPTMEVVDIAAIAEIAHEHGATVVVDNTFATPVLQQPLALGADIVVHSATKFISGHSDVLMGAVVTASDEIRAAILERRSLHGGIPGAFEAWLALRGMRTLPLRLERASANAVELASRLERHAAVGEVRYPGFGAMIAIVLDGADVADRLVRSTSLWIHATSLGGLESTLERRRRWTSEAHGVPEGLVRLSVGIEDVEDLWDDLSSALDQL